MGCGCGAAIVACSGFDFFFVVIGVGLWGVDMVEMGGR